MKRRKRVVPGFQLPGYARQTARIWRIRAELQADRETMPTDHRRNLEHELDVLQRWVEMHTAADSPEVADFAARHLQILEPWRRAK